MGGYKLKTVTDARGRRRKRDVGGSISTTGDITVEGGGSDAAVSGAVMSAVTNNAKALGASDIKAKVVEEGQKAKPTTAKAPTLTSTTIQPEPTTTGESCEDA